MSHNFGLVSHVRFVQIAAVLLGLFQDAFAEWPCLESQCFSDRSKSPIVSTACTFDLAKRAQECPNPKCDTDDHCKLSYIQNSICEPATKTCTGVQIAIYGARLAAPCTDSKECADTSDPANPKPIVGLVCEDDANGANKICKTGRIGSFADCSAATCAAADEECVHQFVCVRRLPAPAQQVPPRPSGGEGQPGGGTPGGVPPQPIPSVPSLQTNTGSDNNGEKQTDDKDKEKEAKDTFTDPSVPKGFKPNSAEGHGPCQSKTHACPDNQICISGECYLRSVLRGQSRTPDSRGMFDDTIIAYKSDGTRKRLPPQPGSPDCRDALKLDGTSDCGSVADLCDDTVYSSLVQEQCPMTCGLCNIP